MMVICMGPMLMTRLKRTDETDIKSDPDATAELALLRREVADLRSQMDQVPAPADRRG